MKDAYLLFTDASKTGVAQEAMQNAVRKAGKAINAQEARQILGVTEQTSWEEIVQVRPFLFLSFSETLEWITKKELVGWSVMQKYDKLFENNAKAGSFYLQSKVHRAKECLEEVYRSKSTPS